MIRDWTVAWGRVRKHMGECVVRPGRWVLAASVLALAGGAGSASSDLQPDRPTVTVYKTPT